MLSQVFDDRFEFEEKAIGAEQCRVSPQLSGPCPGRASDTDNTCIMKCILESAMLCFSVLKCCCILSQYVSVSLQP